MSREPVTVIPLQPSNLFSFLPSTPFPPFLLTPHERHNSKESVAEGMWEKVGRNGKEVHDGVRTKGKNRKLTHDHQPHHMERKI